ncbi:hypothetical protein NQ317_009340 [Molorchus minor]|uniref:Uncharacterized protein n=1 Tax=Molorchus minor TaxID=1323400 RepID=A0ABQ9JRU5_9CUCU|nr:hypothetical protein NQ317_009340 [Molorchus minor]
MILDSYPSGMNQNYGYRLLKWEGSHTPCTLGSLRMRRTLLAVVIVRDVPKSSSKLTEIREQFNFL